MVVFSFRHFVIVAIVVVVTIYAISERIKSNKAR